MFRQDRTNPSTAVSNWKGRHDTPKGHPSTAVSDWLNGSLFGPDLSCPSYTAGATNRAGYIAGGYEIANAVRTARTNRLAFSDETMACFEAGTRVGSPPGGGFANSGTAGYWAAGYAGSSPSTDVFKVAFSSDAMSTLSSGMSVSRRQNSSAGFANSGTAGYLGGGFAASGTTYSNIVDKWAFSDDSRTTLGGTLPRGKYGIAGFANSGSKGYWAGGYGTAYGSPTNQGFMQEISSIWFSTDSIGTEGATIPLYSNMGTMEAGGMANSGTAGYICGGYIGPDGVTGQTRVMKVAFSTGTLSTLSDSLSVGKRNAGTYADSGTAGYSTSGNVNSGTGLTTDKITFSTDATSVLSATILIHVERACGFANTAGL